MSAGHAERVQGLLRRIGRLLSLAATTVIEVGLTVLYFTSSSPPIDLQFTCNCVMIHL